MIEENRLSNIIIGFAIEIHRELGPGLLESAYRECLTYELQKDHILPLLNLNELMTKDAAHDDDLCHVTPLVFYRFWKSRSAFFAHRKTKALN